MKTVQIIHFLLFSIIFGKEIKPVLFSLSGPAAEKQLEMSGLAWAGETLLLLPQYPNPKAPTIYGIERSVIIDRIENPTNPILPKEYTFYMGNILELVPGFQGFEAVCYVWGDLYFLLEAEENRAMTSYLVKGIFDEQDKIIKLNTNKLEKIEVPRDIHNIGFESLIFARNSLWVLFEMNGTLANPYPMMKRYSLGLTEKSEIPFPNVEYRITDFTTVNVYGRFWAINYFWPGNKVFYSEEKDSYAKKYGKGKTHQKYEHVERLLEFQITENGIISTDTQPVELALIKDLPRNWEGLAKIDDRGFIIISDEHPETIFAFIPYSLK